jgi:hypothetical protein
MERLFIELTVCVALIYSVLYYRNKYRASVIHHRDAAMMWRKMMLSVMGEIIGAHFRGSMVNNYIVRLKEEEIEISIGDDDSLIPVDMPAFKLDPNAALDEAYNRFVTNVR